MNLRRRVVRASIIFALAVFALVLVALSVQAQESAVTGPCTGMINGHDFHGTVTVPENNTVWWEFHSNAGNIQSWDVSLHYMGMAIPVDSGVDEDPDKPMKKGVADVNTYAKYGVGIYKLTGSVVAEGGTCSGTVHIVVKGNPLTTMIGAGAAGASVLGVGGGIGSSLSAAKGALGGALK